MTLVYFFCFVFVSFVFLKNSKISTFSQKSFYLACFNAISCISEAQAMTTCQ